MWSNGLEEIVSQGDLGEDWIRMSSGITSELPSKLGFQNDLGIKKILNGGSVSSTTLQVNEVVCRGKLWRLKLITCNCLPWVTLLYMDVYVPDLVLEFSVAENYGI